MPYRYATDAKCATCDHDYSKHVYLNGTFNGAGCLEIVNKNGFSYCQCGVFVAKLDEPLAFSGNLQDLTQGNSAHQQGGAANLGALGGALGGIAGLSGVGLSSWDTKEVLQQRASEAMTISVSGTTTLNGMYTLASEEDIERRVRERVAEELARRDNIRTPSSRKGRKFRDNLT